MALSSRSHYPALAERSFERILLIKPSSLGDVIHALPVLHGLRVRYPQAIIDWLIAKPFAPLIEGHDELDGLVLFDRRRFSRLGRSLRVTREFAKFVHKLRARRYELVIDLQGLFRTGFLARATGAPVRIGFRQAREAAWIFYTHRIPPDDRDTHAVDRNYRTAGLLGFEAVPVEFNLAVSDSIRKDAVELLRGQGLRGDERLIAVVPGARGETKMWPPDRFAETIDELQGSHRLRCALIGGPNEVNLCARIAKTCRSEPVNLAGRTTVRQLAAMVGLADVVLGQDSAAMHLAVALERPLVCLTGPTNPRRTGPYGRPEDVIRLDLDCSPCYLRHLSQCRHNHRCMRELAVATVVSAVTRSLERSLARAL